VQHKTPQTEAATILDRLERDVRIRCRHSNYTEEDTPEDDPRETYNPKIYVKLKDWEPDPCTIHEVEEELATFCQHFTSLVTNHQPAPASNLSKQQEKLLELLRKTKQYIVTPTDKNLGPAILKRSQYMDRCFQDHLLNKSTYRRLTDAESKTLRYNARAHIILAVSQAKKHDHLNHVKKLTSREALQRNPFAGHHSSISFQKFKKVPGKLDLSLAASVALMR
jgi:hypothetical protein